MSLRAYLEAAALSEIEKRSSGNPTDAVPFIGVPKKHPYDDGKLILFCDPLEECPRIVEFRVSDILDAEDAPQPVTDSGESLPLVKLWVRRGAWGLEYHPFEVDDAPRFAKDSQSLRMAINESLFRGQRK